MYNKFELHLKPQHSETKYRGHDLVSMVALALIPDSQHLLTSQFKQLCKTPH